MNIVSYGDQSRPWVGRLLVLLVRKIQSHALLTSLLFIPLVMGAFWICSNHLKLETDYADLISEKLPFHKTWMQYRSEFSSISDTIVAVIDSSSPQASRKIRDDLLAYVRSESKVFERVFVLNDHPWFEEHFWWYLKPEEIPQVLGALQTPESPSFSSSENSRLYVEIKPHLDFGLLVPAETSMMKLYSFQEKIAGTYQTDAPSVRFTGVAPLAYEEMENIAKAMQWSGIAAFLITALILFWGLGSVRLTLITLVGLIVGLLFTGVFAAFAVGHLNMISIAFAVLFIGLGVDYSLHLFLRYRELLVNGVQHGDALVEAVAEVGQSLWLCALTTCAGFYAFIPTSYQGVVELGIISGTGMFINFMVQVTLLPALVHLFPHRPEKLHAFRPSQVGALLNSLVLQYAKPIRIGAIAISLVGLFFVTRVGFDPNPMSLQDPRTPAFKTFQSLMDDPSMSPWTIKIMESSRERARQLSEELARVPEVSSVVWAESLLPPRQNETIAMLSSLQKRNPRLAHMIPPLKPLQLEDLPSDLRDRYISPSGIYRLEVFPRDNLNDIHAMRTFANAVLKIAPQATDDPVTIPKTADSVVQAFLIAGILALVLTFLVLFSALRRVRDTSMAMVPLIVGGLMVVIMMGLLKESFNFANIIVLPMLLGIAMDSGVHVILKYRLSSAENPIAGSTSRAMFFSALVNISSFGTMIFAHHLGMASMGLVLSVGLAFMLGCTFVVLPALLSRDVKSADDRQDRQVASA